MEMTPEVLVEGGVGRLLRKAAVSPWIACSMAVNALRR